LAAIVVAVVAVFAIRATSNRNRLQGEEQERRHRERRDDERRVAAVSECWQRFRWVVEQGRIEPAASAGATLGAGPKLVLAVLRGLLEDAEKLGDDTLAKAVAAHLDQFSLVLAQQSGRPAKRAATAPPGAAADINPEPAHPQEKGEAPAAPVADGAPTPTRQAAAGARRRRR
jgi:hypothetical protein